jgi:hypothetical protein
VLETVTHVKRLDIKKGAMTSFEEFLDKISPLKTANKLGAIVVFCDIATATNKHGIKDVYLKACLRIN